MATILLLDLNCPKLAIGLVEEIAALTGTFTSKLSAFNSFSMRYNCFDRLVRSLQNNAADPNPAKVAPMVEGSVATSPVTDSHHNGYPRSETVAIM